MKEIVNSFYFLLNVYMLYTRCDQKLLQIDFFRIIKLQISFPFDNHVKKATFTFMVVFLSLKKNVFICGSLSLLFLIMMKVQIRHSH